MNDALPMSLAELEDFLLSEAVSDEAMTISELDGFLAAVAAGPMTIDPGEWLPEIWGDDEPDFADEDEADAVIGAIMARFDDILHTLEHVPEAYEPVIETDEISGDALPDLWAEGFLAGISLRAAAWRGFVDGPAGGAFAPVAVFLRDDAGRLVASGEEAEALRAEAHHGFPDLVRAAQEWFRERRGFFEGRTKLGRNDSCFCGSGRKFKKCCGA